MYPAAILTTICCFFRGFTRTEGLERRAYHSSRFLRNAETQSEEKASEEPKKTRKTEGPAYAPQGALVEPEWPPFGKWPYAWIGLTIATFALFGYTWFIMREEKMIERYEFVKWGGELDRIHSLKKLRKYLAYDGACGGLQLRQNMIVCAKENTDQNYCDECCSISGFGIIVSERMSNFGLAEVTLAAASDESKEVQSLALEVFCGFTANERLRAYLIEELKAVDGLRKFADSKNLYMWHAIGNLAEGNAAVCQQIATDEYYMDCLLDTYERSLMLNDMYFLRPLIRLLSHLAADKQSALLLSTKYKEKLEELMGVFIMPEAQSMVNAINLRFRLAKNVPEHWPDLVSELESAGIHQEEKSSLLMYSMIHQSMAVGAAGVAWSLFRAWRLKGKFEPMARSERAWVRRAVWTSPITAIALSFSIYLVEQVSEKVSHSLQWEGFRDARYAYAPYFALLPIYWTALNFAGPFATLPSFIRIRYRETMPPYNYHLRDPLLDAMVSLGLIDSREIDPSHPDRFTTNLGEIALQNQIVRQKLKEDAEWVANQQKSKKWFGIF